MSMASIDLEHLAKYTGGEKDLNGEILRLFDSQIAGMVTELNSLIAGQNSKRWREIAHTIKGAARGVGAFDMGEAAAKAEPVNPADRPAALAALQKLEQEAQTVRAFIRQYLA
jgi:HPt (histidine-containing phosphotransfer) domain-containing protein